MKFKKGDKVRIINVPNSNLVSCIGNIGSIDKLDSYEDAYLPYKVRLEEKYKNNFTWWFRENDLEIIDEKIELNKKLEIALKNLNRS